MDKGGGEYQEFPSIFFCLTVPKNLVGEPFRAVFQKISSSKSLWKRVGGGEYQEFPSIFFCLTMPKNLVGKSFSVSLISGIIKIRDK